MSSPQPSTEPPAPETPEDSKPQPKKPTAKSEPRILTADDPLLVAIGALLDSKLQARDEAAAATLQAGLKAASENIATDLTGLIKQAAEGLTGAISELIDKTAGERLKNERELMMRSDTLTASILSDEMDEGDLLLRFDVSLLRKDGTALIRARGHNTMSRAMAANCLSESPEQLETALLTRINRPLIGALQQAVAEALMPKAVEEDLPPLLPPVEEPPPTQRAQQEHRLQSDPPTPGAGSDLH